ncbi:hypothetical protein KQX54_012925 [Cotesia glomerata]|uniref:Protein kinase domain-containing protein n=1 Tax=Cotesia glomerata TaxID=32391 RepID=A0AAV7IYY9_COTGL|nr:hypothetical protein KQX54_012925 [Cotesia glomerata]
MKRTPTVTLSAPFIDIDELEFTDNVLGLSKMCDLWSSSLLNTTVGNHFQGTPLYMAPEILLDNCPTSTHSDTWSMACYFVELFSEKSVLDVKPTFSVPNLRQLVRVQKKPTLNEIPMALQSRLSDCFEHEPK